MSAPSDPCAAPAWDAAGAARGSRALRRSSWPVRIGVALVSLALALAGAEVFFRVRAHRGNERTLQRAFEHARRPTTGAKVRLVDIIRPSLDDAIIYEMVPNLRSVLYQGGILSTNSAGFRSPEYAAAPRPDSVTILGLGDSLMFGQGVDDGQVYLALLLEKLKSAYPQTRWRVINSGAPGYNTMNEVALLKRHGLAYAPDLVLIDLVGNDLALPGYVRVEDPVLALDRSFLLDALRTWLGRADRARMQPDARAIVPRAVFDADFAEDSERIPPRYRDQVGFVAFCRALDELEVIVREKGLEVVFFSQHPFHQAQLLLAEVGRRGFRVISLSVEIEQYMREHEHAEYTPEDYARSSLAASPTDPHPSAIQHRMAVEKLFGVLSTDGTFARLVEGVKE